eukprot:Skav202163  [mRNA]  locus=scaffold970:361877:362977:- [translate_table: standard]
MTWWCNQCQQTNAPGSEYCQSCQQHWTQCWQKKRRSRSKHAKSAKEKASRSTTDRAPAQSTVPATVVQDNPRQIFAKDPPWMPTTPAASMSSKLSIPVEPEPASTYRTDLPPPPVLPPPPSGGPTSTGQLSDEEKTMLQHLRGIASTGMQLTEQMATRLQELEQKAQETLPIKTLSHSHLNKLTRLRNQVSAATQKVLNLDKEWQEFVSAATTRLQEHGIHYQRTRADYLENLNKKVAELSQMKQELSLASQQLLGQDAPPTDLPPASTLTADFQGFNEALAKAGTVDSLQAIDLSDMEDDAMPEGDAEEVEDPPTDGRPPIKRSTIKVAPFRGAPSPTKVAKGQLKARTEQRPAKETKEIQEELL